MSLLKDFSPKRTRERKSGPPKSKNDLTEVHSHPVQKIVQKIDPEITEELINKYSYHPGVTKNNENENDSFRAIAQVEQKVFKEEKIKEPEIVAPITFGFFELRLKCEEYLLIYLYGIKNIEFEKIINLRKDFIMKKMEAISEYKKEVEFHGFKDYLYYYKGEVIIPEEYQDLTGFLREYFNITKVAILYDTGEILLIESYYCNFWFKKRLDKYIDGSLRELSHSEIINDENCLDCMYNWNCPFARVQQMAN